MHPLQYVIGLDGGGTKTAAEFCDASGRIVTTAQGGPSNFQVIGVETSAKTILDLLETCCHGAGCTVADVGTLVAGLTGAGRPGDQSRMVVAIEAEATRRGFTLKKTRVESDARIALEGAFGGRPGLIVIAGTGSIVFGKDKKGNIHRSGGWGRIIGDEGSGYAIGREAFRAVAAAIDGRGKATTLSSKLAKQAGLGDSGSIINAIYKEGFDVASIAPIVMDCAERGDKVAKLILRGAARDIVGVIEPVALKLRSGARMRTKVPIAFVGGLLANKNFYSTTVRSVLRSHIPSVRVQEPDSSPAHGAVLMALDGVHS